MRFNSAQTEVTKKEHEVIQQMKKNHGFCTIKTKITYSMN